MLGKKLLLCQLSSLFSLLFTCVYVCVCGDTTTLNVVILVLLEALHHFTQSVKWCHTLSVHQWAWGDL